MATEEYIAQLGHAWALHREGRNEPAIDEFTQMLREAPDNIDVLYGLGLAQRAAHLREEAKQTFERCLSLVDQALEQNPDEDRYEMLQRFLHQRLAELNAAS
jgi:tetratricopeptide (TPR) repeat protein